MENASKALIMAASVLIALMIIGALLLMFNNLSNYQESGIKDNREAQVIEFNNQYETYDRNEVRGSDMISLANRIIDYNKRKSEEGYMKMEIDIIIGAGRRKEFAYNENSIKLVKASYNQDNLTDLVGVATNKNTPKGLEDKYGAPYISELSSNISNIMDTTNGEDKAKEILKKSLSTYGGIDRIRTDTTIYFEYSQFKRAYFNCVDRRYDNTTGRIVYMKFEYQKIGV